MTPLHWGAQISHVQVVETLLEYGASTHTVNKFGLSPLELAFQQGNSHILSLIQVRKA